LDQFVTEAARKGLQRPLRRGRETGSVSLGTLQESGRSDSWSGSHAPESEALRAHTSYRSSSSGRGGSPPLTVCPCRSRRPLGSEQRYGPTFTATAAASRTARSVERVEENTEEEEGPVKGRQGNECKKPNHVAHMCRGVSQHAQERASGSRKNRTGTSGSADTSRKTKTQQGNRRLSRWT